MTRQSSYRASTWLAAAAGLFLLVVAGGAWYALRVIRALPGEIAAGGRQVMHQAAQEVDDLVRGFKTGTVERRFTAFTTRVDGTNYLQVATLDQQQTFELEDSTALLWGTVELPPVVVRASAPVQYTYFVDLEAPWQMELRDHRVLVMAPDLRFNRPAVDVSRMRWHVVQGSLLRDEQSVLLQLKREITGRTAIQARANLPQVRAISREEIARFVRNWLLQSYPDAKGYTVEVYFTDETPSWQRALSL